MNKTELTRTVKEMIAAPSCCQELKAAGQNYLNALGTDAEKAAAAKKLLMLCHHVIPRFIVMISLFLVFRFIPIYSLISGFLHLSSRKPFLFVPSY